jgi:hypothetical protein
VAYPLRRARHIVGPDQPVLNGRKRFGSALKPSPTRLLPVDVAQKDSWTALCQIARQIGRERRLAGSTLRIDDADRLQVPAPPPNRSVRRGFTSLGAQSSVCRQRQQL